MDDEAQERIDKIKTSLEKMNPSNRLIHLDSIDQLIEGSAALVDIKLPKGAQMSALEILQSIQKPAYFNNSIISHLI